MLPERDRTDSWTDSGWIGAGPDDDFERELEAADDSFDVRLPHVVTALGPIAPDALGVTLIAGPNRPQIGVGQDPGGALLELEQLYALGVRAIVDLASAVSPQGLADVMWISARAPVHIIIGANPAASPVRGGAEAARAGVAIGDVAAIERANRVERGRPLLVPVASRGQLEQVIARAESSKRGRGPWLVIDTAMVDERGHLDAAFARGFGLALIVAPSDFGSMDWTAALCRRLVDRGFGDRLVLGYNRDPIRLMERLPVLLMEAGLPATTVWRLLVENPARALTVRPAE